MEAGIKHTGNKPLQPGTCALFNKMDLRIHNLMLNRKLMQKSKKKNTTETDSS